ncbi:hypothetical protein FHG87_003910 [Trinorchestia longiramus]|nr:hypothetical protein FHG87_003910 [Trinorchestia longiramus]
MEGEEGEEGGSSGSVEAPESDESDEEPQDDSMQDVLPDVNMASPSNNFQMLLSPSTSLASPSGPPSLLPSPASLASPTTPGDLKEVFAPIPPQQLAPRIPVGTNPRDLNNPLSVNQLTGQCITSSDTQAQDPQHPAMGTSIKACTYGGFFSPFREETTKTTKTTRTARTTRATTATSSTTTSTTTTTTTTSGSNWILGKVHINLGKFHQ